jgi:dTDP-glucose 4,6-dehydratase
MILVTGSAGFIGTNFVLDWLSCSDEPVISLDALTYAGNRENLSSLDHDERHIFVHGDICDAKKVSELLKRYQPRAIIHLAAESHVDRSIFGPAEFLRTNVQGTFTLLEAARVFHASLNAADRDTFRFVHISTDEVYGSLGPDDAPFVETSPYAPNSPYSASKAASDHFVRAYFHTYRLPVITTNCSNNYGPYQFPEKLIPLMISNALSDKPLPVYGDGLNIRDWLYVSDHCSGIRMVLERGIPGQTYNIGGLNEKRNIEIVQEICTLLDEFRPSAKGPYERLITFVKDRPGHDRRYAINPSKIMTELGWAPQETFQTGIRKTVRWYLEHQAWIENITSGAYRRWIEQNYAQRGEVSS